jgi:coenzyme F420 hydrogenase subunit beta
MTIDFERQSRHRALSMLGGSAVRGHGVGGAQRRLLASVVDAGRCTGCSACAGTCPYMLVAGDGIVALKDCSLSDGHCLEACPRVESVLESRDEGDDELGTVLSIHSARHVDRTQIGVGFGFVTSLLIWAIETRHLAGAIVAGSNPLNPAATIARSADELIAAAGTRHTVVPNLALLPRLGAEELALVALPCQALALERLTSSVVPRPVGRPLVIGLHCGGAFDARALATRVRELTGPKAVTGVAIKSGDVRQLEVATADGARASAPLTDAAALMRTACSTCHDLTAETSDLAVGNYGPDARYNLVLVRTPRGNKLWQAALASGSFQAMEVSSEELSRLRGAAAAKHARARRVLSGAGSADRVEGSRDIVP